MNTKLFDQGIVKLSTEKAYLDFTCYATEAVKKENLVTWSFTVKPTEYNKTSWFPTQK